MKNHKAKKKNHTANNQKINRANNQAQKLRLSSKSIPCMVAFFFFFFLEKATKIEKLCRRDKEVSLSSKMFSIVLQKYVCVNTGLHMEKMFAVK
jgi:hypothetical protein